MGDMELKNIVQETLNQIEGTDFTLEDMRKANNGKLKDMKPQLLTHLLMQCGCSIKTERDKTPDRRTIWQKYLGQIAQPPAAIQPVGPLPGPVTYAPLTPQPNQTEEEEWEEHEEDDEVDETEDEHEFETEEVEEDEEEQPMEEGNFEYVPTPPQEADYWQTRAYHYTAATSSLDALIIQDPLLYQSVLENAILKAKSKGYNIKVY